MIPRRLGLLAVLVVLSISTSLASNTWVVREDGIGPVKIGMRLSQLNTVLDETFSKPDGDDDQGCFYVNPTKHTNVAFMIENGRLARIEVNAKGVSTAEGIQVGDSEVHALQVYGPRLKVEPQAYTGPEGHYLTVRSKDGRYGIRFETEKGKIEMFYAGSIKAIQYIEGCE